VPVGGVQPAAPFGREHEGVAVRCELVVLQVLVEQFSDESRHGNGASSGVRLGLGAVAAHLGRGLEHPQLTAGCVHAPDTEPGHLREAQPTGSRHIHHRPPPLR
jgi:hypothetical protein